MDRTNLHTYQQRAVQFVKDTPHSALLMQMGTGKSVVTLTAVQDLIDGLDIEKVLVIAPKKVAETTWTSEVEMWDHLRTLRVARVMGTEKKRIEALKEKADIYVIGRDSFVWLVKYYKGRLPFDMIVIDELTSFKSTTSQRFKAFKLIRTQPDRIVGLTGTPAPNGYEDLFAQIYCIDGGERLGKYITHFRNNYMNIVMSHAGFPVKKELKKGAKEIIDAKLKDICLAMKSEDYLTLPPRQDIKQIVELPNSIYKQYKEFEKESVLSVNKDEEITASSAAALMTKLRQFSNGALYDAERMVKHVHDEKISALVELVEAAQSPVLVFYQFIHDKDRIKDALKSYKVRIYEGEQDLKDWNQGKIDVLLAHPASCAYGLNLQHGGHICVWFGVGWDLELYEQANARLYRQGQQQRVLIYHLLSKGTIDERIYQSLQNKAKGQDSLMNAMKELIKQYSK